MSSLSGTRLNPTPQKLLVLVCLCMVISMLWLPTMIMLKITENCSFTSTVGVVQHVCSMYQAKLISGNMCSSLCDHDHFKYSHCGNDKYSDKIVLILNCDGCHLEDRVDKVVVKVGLDVERWTTMTNQLLNYTNFNDAILDNVRRIVKNEIQKNVGSSSFLNEDVITLILGKHFNQYINETFIGVNTNKTAIRTVLSLALQNEYTKMVALKHHGISPEVFGFCGPAFFMEYTPPLTLQGYTLPFKAIPSELVNYRFENQPWSVRAKAAIGLLQNVRKLDNHGNHTLEICDVHPKNAGINKNIEIVFFDLDYTRYTMRFENEPCLSDKVCNHAACKGYCDLDRKQCKATRRNNNLQAVCLNLFYSYGGINGLLRFPPSSIKRELSLALQQCIHPEIYSKNNSSSSYKAGHDLSLKLETILKKSLS